MKIHWSDQYVGQPYVPQTGDCAAFAQRVAREILKIDPGLPQAESSHYRAQTRQIIAHKDAYAVKIEQPEDGHPVLMLARGKLCHIGVMCRVANRWWILHADQPSGQVLRQREKDLSLKYQVEGYYRWIAQP